MLHYDKKQKHFVLIKTLVEYANVLQCPDYNRVYKYNKCSEFHKHETKYIAPEKELTFIKKEISPTLSLFERTFGQPLTRDIYFGFDFEAFLEPIDTDFQFDTQAKEINTHRSIAFVFQCSDPKYKTIRYCDLDAPEVFIKILKELQEKVIEDIQTNFKQKYKKQIFELYQRECKYEKIPYKLVTVTNQQFFCHHI